MTTVVSDLNLLGKLPPRSEIGFLDQEISGEGQKITMDASQAEILGGYQQTLSYPDFSQLKPLRKYFGRVGYQVYPSWIFHPTEAKRIVENAEEAAKFGVAFRRTTPDERAAFGVNYKWDYSGEWRTKPYVSTKKRAIDIDNLETGKNYIPRNSPEQSQAALIEALIPQVAAAVAAALKVSAPTAPGKVNPEKWARFQEFLAFEESAKAVSEAIQETDVGPSPPTPADEDLGDGGAIRDYFASDGDEKTIWTAEAERMGIKVDKRWGIERLKEECQRAAA